MDLQRQRTEYSASVSLDWGFAVGLVLHTGTRDGRKSAIDALDRRAIHTDAILWSSENELVARQTRIWRQSETGEAADEADGVGSHLLQAAFVGPLARTSNLSLFAERYEHRSSKPSMVQRHHLHSTQARIHLSGCGHGLVQPVRAVVGSIGFDGHIVLRGRVGLGAAAWPARDFQYGSRFAIHQRGLHQPVAQAWDQNQHGWPRPSDRQHIHRTALAFGEVRRGLSQGLSGCDRGDIEPEILFPVLQLRTAASGSGLSNSGRCPSRVAEGQKIAHTVSPNRLRSSSINDPGKEFFRQILMEGHKERKK